jgi:hypothetical protein
MSDLFNLEPCPFCGATAKGRSHRNVDEIIITHKDDCMISCLGHESDHLCHHWGDSSEKGVLFRYWNNRARLPNRELTGGEALRSDVVVGPFPGTEQ